MKHNENKPPEVFAVEKETLQQHSERQYEYGMFVGGIIATLALSKRPALSLSGFAKDTAIGALIGGAAILANRGLNHLIYGKSYAPHTPIPQAMPIIEGEIIPSSQMHQVHEICQCKRHHSYSGWD